MHPNNDQRWLALPFSILLPMAVAVLTSLWGELAFRLHIHGGFDFVPLIGLIAGGAMAAVGRLRAEPVLAILRQGLLMVVVATSLAFLTWLAVGAQHRAFG